MSKQSNPEVFMVLDGGRQVPKWVYDAAYKLVQQFMPHMLHGHRYTLETICGNAFWDQPVPRLRIWAGQSMAHMVSSNLLPLVFAETGGKRTKQYQLQ